MPLSRAAAIARAAGVRLEWLATGEGPMRPGERSVEHGTADGAIIKADEGMGPAPRHGEEASKAPEGWTRLPRYEVEASAGGGRLVEAESVVDWWLFREDWLRRQGIRPDRAALVRVDGDSMVPLITPGDIVLVDLGAPALFREGIWLVWYDGLLVKRVGKTRTGYLLLSQNPEYDPIHVEQEEAGDESRFRLIGQVRWLARSV